MSFDTRNAVLGMTIEEHWTEDIRQMWADNQAAITTGLLAQLGPEDGEAKLENYRLMGPEPWSVIFEHTVLLRQVRASFAHGDFYPALVGVDGPPSSVHLQREPVVGW